MKPSGASGRERGGARLTQRRVPSGERERPRPAHNCGGRGGVCQRASGWARARADAASRRWASAMPVIGEWVVVACEVAVILMIAAAVGAKGLKRKNHHQQHHVQ